MYELVRYVPDPASGGNRPAYNRRLMPPRQAAEPAERRRDAERTRNEILEVATREFAANGYAGARVDDMAERMRTTKRMIYYYFGGKEQLFIAVLERAYAEIRRAERAVDVDGLDPAAAVRRIAELTFDHHESHPDFIRLVSIENIHHAEHMARSPAIAELGSPAIDLLERILERGSTEGVFRTDVDADRRPHDDQRVLRLPGRQPPHVRHAVRPRSRRPRSCASTTAGCSAR